MHPVVAATHGKVAATVVHLLGDPSMDWAAFAEFCQEHDEPQLEALALALAEFNTWAAANLTAAAVEVHGRLDTDSAPSDEVAKPETPQVKEWCPGAGQYKANEVERVYDEGGFYNVCPSCGHRSATARHGMNWTVRRHKRPARPAS